MAHTRLEIRVEDPYNLELTLFPSFVLTIYRRRGDAWERYAGKVPIRAFVQQVEERLLVELLKPSDRDEEVEEVLSLELGTWHPPFEQRIGEAPPRFAEVLSRLSHMYRGVRLSIAPHEADLLFVAVALSKRTDYHRMVLKWLQKLWEVFGGDLEEIAEASKEELVRVGTSYQVMELPALVSQFLELKKSSRTQSLLKAQSLRRSDVFELRTLLLRRIKGIGPKAVDAFLMSTKKAPWLLPCDANLQRIVSRTGLVKGFVSPQKALCARYACDREVADELEMEFCPLAEDGRCLVALLSDLGELRQWFQTLCYIHGKLRCLPLKPRCGDCALLEICEYAEQRRR